MKPGYKTTEFWLTLAAVVFGAVHSSGLLDTESHESKALAFVVAGLAALGYSISRGLAKQYKQHPEESQSF